MPFCASFADSHLQVRGCGFRGKDSSKGAAPRRLGCSAPDGSGHGLRRLRAPGRGDGALHAALAASPALRGAEEFHGRPRLAENTTGVGGRSKRSRPLTGRVAWRSMVGSQYEPLKLDIYTEGSVYFNHGRKSSERNAWR